MPEITGTFEDREQIRELYARYAQYIDAARFEKWVECFTQQYQTSWEGGGVRHMMVNVSFDVNGDTAVGTCSLIYFKIHDGKSEFVLTGGYHDTLRKEGGQWRFTHRKVYIDQ